MDCVNIKSGGFTLRRVKRIGTIIAVCLCVCGFLGFFIYLGCMYNPQNIMPMYSVNAIFVDKSGRIYFGCSDASRVQVFDNKGEYLYSNTFNTLGMFYYIAGEDGVVNVYTPRENMAYVFSGQELISKTRISQEYEANTIKMLKEKMEAAKSFRDTNGNAYRIDGQKVFIKQAGTDFYSRLRFQVPLFPLNFMICGIIFWAGALTLLFLNQKAISRIMPEK